MRLVFPILLVSLLGGCSPPIAQAFHIMPRPAPYDPAPPLGAFGPVLPPEVTVPYASGLPDR